MRVILFLASDFDERKPSVYWTRNSTVLIATVSTGYLHVSIVQCTVMFVHCTVVPGTQLRGFYLDQLATLLPSVEVFESLGAPNIMFVSPFAANSPQ